MFFKKGAGKRPASANGTAAGEKDAEMIRYEDIVSGKAFRNGDAASGEVVWNEGGDAGSVDAVRDNGRDVVSGEVVREDGSDALSGEVVWDEGGDSGKAWEAKNGLTVIRGSCMHNIVLPHTLMAAATVTGTSIVNVPFTDSVPLMGIQVKMVMNILSEYGIRTDVADIAKNLTGSTLISYIGRTLSSQIFGLIPFAGQVAKSVVNVSVAASVTAILGAATSYICEGYVSHCLDSEGAVKPEFAKYFNNDTIRTAMDYVSKHKDEFDIDGILKGIKDKGKGTNKGA